MKELELTPRQAQMIQRAIVCYKVVDDKLLSEEDQKELANLYIELA